MIKTDIKLPFNYSDEDIFAAISQRLPIEREEVKKVEILKRSLNIEDKSDIHYTASVGLCLSADREAGLLKMKKKVSKVPDYSINLPTADFSCRPLVVGAGPAGLFAALLLAEAGARPVVIERGLAVDERTKRVDTFTKFGILDPECNIQFGEGGAGTFSDGKLKVGGMDKYKHKVLSEFVSAGAPDEIMYTVG
ncbi:MAG: FAD-dependent monooxygenase, partial [Clostridia bacterium]|nr:FAD-dependent monooxygenase [Clostridia bacterium]